MSSIAADPGSSSLVLDKQRNRILATAALAAARKLADEGKRYAGIHF